jgi:3-hydroxyisobutyrate dehydrogenase
MLKVGFIGLGDMGSAIARRIIDAGLPTALWARRAATLQAFADCSVTRCSSVAELGRFADVVGLCVFNDADVREVIIAQGLLSAMKSGSVILIHSTVSPEVCEEMAAAGAARGIVVLDAPVSGGREGAQAGKLATMVGGDPIALERSRPVIESFSTLIRLMGPIGSGQRMKVLNNMLTFANGRVANIVVETAQRFGLDPFATMDVLRTGGARSFALDTMIEKLLPDPAYQKHALTMIDKERNLFAHMRVAGGLPRGVLDELSHQHSELCVPRMDVGRAVRQPAPVMDQRLNMVMVGVKDMAKLRKFYEQGLGWTNWIPADDNQAMYKVGGSILVLLPAPYLAAESGVPAASAPKSFWAIFYDTKEQVAATYAAAINAGAASTSGLRDRDYDVYSGYFSDPEGNGWEVVWSPHMGPDQDGALQLNH